MPFPGSAHVYCWLSYRVPLVLTCIAITCLYYKARQTALHDRRLAANLTRQLPSIARYGTDLDDMSAKFVYIPFFFVMLRIWGLILAVLYVLPNSMPKHLHAPLHRMVYACDALQGFANCVLFVALNQKVRDGLCGRSEDPVHPSPFLVGRTRIQFGDDTPSARTALIIHERVPDIP
eukprot:NODE_1923_length_1034_cov_67.002030_g1565_i0.p1 GENE.NODE_1923_length_1034_cov_67.002030_g1565_i0~~NODE_1923_length_1034_cov_67.002030_g1565_i0.p1  ORF type:complete len:177 (+),score=23.20 NODE_1923_length_1034_cov_67.002030_g1565_i0:479-1009(+)